MTQELNEAELLEHSLNPRDIAIHHRRIKRSLEKSKTSFIKIIDSFRLDNGGILPQEYFSLKSRVKTHGFVAFIPAAGAASRYFQPLQALRHALSKHDESLVRSEIEELVAEGAKDWPLPTALDQLIHLETHEPFPSLEFCKRALEEIDWPKALLPFESGKGSFLKKKREEHLAMPALLAEVYVAPRNGSKIFAEHLGVEPTAKHIAFMEQGPELSTLRFGKDTLPYRDQNGEISVVPAGHGMLVRLFPEVKTAFPEAHSLFIRNIDNVIQDEENCLQDTELFLAQHQAVLEQLKDLRQFLETQSYSKAAELAEQIRLGFKERKKVQIHWLSSLGDNEQKLWKLLFEVFHCPIALANELRAKDGDLSSLKSLYFRPLNSLGQVPNNGRDVGGSPVLAEHEDGEVAICLELPHASPEDKKTFLENPAVATHFNPVFVAAEIPEDNAVYDLEKCPFWILAEKNIYGTPVVYHEIVLYEVLGNSYTANVIFPEIPRRLFNPHKTLLDGVKKA